MTKLKITESSRLEKVQLFKLMYINRTIIFQSLTKEKLKEKDYLHITFGSVLE